MVQCGEGSEDDSRVAPRKCSPDCVLLRTTAEASSLPLASQIIVLVSLVSPRSRVENRSSGGTSLHSLSMSGLLLCIHPTISLLLLWERYGEFPRPTPGAERLIVRRSIRIHSLSLLNGSPYCTLPSNVIVRELPQLANPTSINRLSITSFRAMVHVYYSETAHRTSTGVWRIFVWDWKTGDSVRLLRLD